MKYLGRMYLGLGLLISLGWSSTFAALPNFTSYVEHLQSAVVHSETPTPRESITSFCQQVLQTKGFVREGVAYTPQQSVFLFVLCTHVGQAEGFSPHFAQKTGEFFKLLSFRDLGFQDFVYDGDGQPSSDQCDSPSLAGCNIAQHSSDLLGDIINDYFNLKEPSLYGYRGPGVANEQAVNTFAQYYFPGVDLCVTPPIFPKTCKAALANLVSAQASLQDTHLLDAQAIAKYTSCDPEDEDYSLMACSIYGGKGINLSSLVYLIYNELAYYRLFQNYYLLSLEVNKQFSDQTEKTLFAQKTIFDNQYAWHQQALSRSIRMFRDIAAAYPLHIGFLIYQEDLALFGKQLATLVSPLYSLYNKLRNVQTP